MGAVGVYDPVWAAMAVALLAPAFFMAVCRRSLERFSRKALLARVPPDRHERLEKYLSFKDEYQSNLESLELILRLLIVVFLAFGKWLTLDPEARLSGGSLVEGLGSAFIVWGEILVLALVFLYLIPSVVARVAAESWLLRTLPLIDSMYRGTSVFRKFVDGVGRVVAVLFGGREERTSADIVEEEILSAVGEGQREGILMRRDIHMIESIMNFGDVEVSEVMTPRTEMVALDVEDGLEKNLERVVECGHSRIPVYRENKDRIIGVLYVKDLQKFLLRKRPIELEKVVRKPYFVSEKKKISELLQEFKGHRHHLGIVQDEHGGTEGLVTIEDIIEEIVGDIQDEYETEKSPVRRVSDDVVEIEASVHIDDLNEELDVALPEGETYDTVGGFLFETLGRVPAVGDTYESNGVRFEVTDADDRRVHRLRLKLPPRPEQKPRQPATPSSAGDGEPQGGRGAGRGS